MKGIVRQTLSASLDLEYDNLIVEFWSRNRVRRVGWKGLYPKYDNYCQPAFSLQMIFHVELYSSVTVSPHISRMEPLYLDSLHARIGVSFNFAGGISVYTCLLDLVCLAISEGGYRCPQVRHVCSDSSKISRCPRRWREIKSCVSKSIPFK